MKKAKKQRIVYKENASSKAAELEEFLFGTHGNPSSIFEREAEQGEETVAELINKQAKLAGDALRDTDLFFEDTRGGAGVSSDGRDEDEEDDDEAAGARGGRGRGVKARARIVVPAVASGSSSESDPEEKAMGNKKKKKKKSRRCVKQDGDDAEEADVRGDESGPSSAEGSDQEEEGRAREGGQDSDSGSDEGEEGRGDDDGAAARIHLSGAAGTAGRQQQQQREEEEEAHAAGRKQQQQRRQRGDAASGPGRLGGDGGGGHVAVWSDPHDEALVVDVVKAARLRKLRTSAKQTTMHGPEYEAALRKQHQALNPRTKWAAKRSAAAAAAAGSDEEADEEGVEGLLGRAGGLVERPAGRRLPTGQIEMTRLKDANQHQPSDAVVRAVRFHPNGQVLLTAGLDKKLRLFQVDGLRNPLLQAVQLEDMPITEAAFASATPAASAAASDRVVLAGRRSFFYVYDMGAARVERVRGPSGCPLKSLEMFAVAPAGSSAPSAEPLVAFAGDSGFIPLVSLRSRQWVANLKMSGNVRALAFTHDGLELLSSGDDGVVHVWDLRTRRCRLALVDSGNIGDSSSLAMSPDQRYLATGSRSGVVNVYRWAEVEEEAARAASGGGGGGRVAVPPARELLNLTTNVDTLVFSPDSQMLAMSSRMKRDALRLVHLPSLTVFANWPTSGTPLHYVHSVDFSPHCALLAIGNAKGRALLYRLHHYQQA